MAYWEWLPSSCFLSCYVYNRLVSFFLAVTLRGGFNQCQFTALFPTPSTGSSMAFHRKPLQFKGRTRLPPSFPISLITRNGNCFINDMLLLSPTNYISKEQRNKNAFSLEGVCNKLPVINPFNRRSEVLSKGSNYLTSPNCWLQALRSGTGEWKVNALLRGCGFLGHVAFYPLNSKFCTHLPMCAMSWRKVTNLP